MSTSLAASHVAASQVAESQVAESQVAESQVAESRAAASHGTALAPAIAELGATAAACATAARHEVATLSDADLLDHQRSLATAHRHLELAAASLAAEIAHRSRRELGYTGLAQRLGARSPEVLVQTVTGTNASTARRLVSVGTMVAEFERPASATTPVESWLAPLVAAVAAGTISPDALAAVRAGLGAPTESVSPDALRAATLTLIDLVPTMTVELLAARARELRDDLDSAGIAAREHERRERRSLRLFPQLDGMTKLVALLDPESAAVITSAIDAATSPRRGGPRFVDPTDAAAAQRVVDDPRTTEQLALDALIDLVDVAVRTAVPAADGTHQLPRRRPDVRILVTQHDLDARSGAAFIDGQTASVSIATAERHACDGGFVPILFDEDAAALNLGRSQRLHSQRQRIAIAARDGGCLAPGCERPASWCEVHHIREFSRGGMTDLSDGVLLCRHHHMLVHNNQWRVDRMHGRYMFVPPPDVDPRQRPIPLQTKSAAVRRLMAAAR